MDHDHTAAILNWIANLASLGTIAMTLLGVLPALAAIVAAGWYAIQIYESNTVMRWRKNRQQRKIARLKAKLAMLQVECDLLAQIPPTPTSTQD